MINAFAVLVNGEVMGPYAFFEIPEKDISFFIKSFGAINFGGTIWEIKTIRKDRKIVLKTKLALSGFETVRNSYNRLQKQLGNRCKWNKENNGFGKNLL
jgi:hypothetical protein